MVPEVTGADPRSPQTTAVVLVEGLSDKLALETLAVRRGRDLSAEGVAVVEMGGAMSISRFLDHFGPGGLALRVSGLCDESEEGFFRRGLERAGFGRALTRTDMEGVGFYTCVVDLEDELIRAVGTAAVEEVVASQGDLASFRIFQKQPAQQQRSIDKQLHRFLGTRSGRKGHYAVLLVAALDLAKAPRPLDGVLAHLTRTSGERPAHDHGAVGLRDSDRDGM
jgi:hypothetical protein